MPNIERIKMQTRKEQQKNWKLSDRIFDYFEYVLKRWNLWWGDEYYFQTSHDYTAYFQDTEKAIPHKNLKEKTGMSFDDVDCVTKRGTFVRRVFVIEGLAGRIHNLLNEEYIEMQGRDVSRTYVVNVKKEYFDWQDVARAVLKYGEFVCLPGKYHLDGNDVGYVHKNYSSLMWIFRKEKTGHFLMIEEKEKQADKKHFRQQITTRFSFAHQIAKMIEQKGRRSVGDKL